MILAVSLSLLVIGSIIIQIFFPFSSLNTQKLGKISTGGSVIDVYVIDNIAFVADKEQG